jgi:hypothetical protein
VGELTDFLALVLAISSTVLYCRCCAVRGRPAGGMPIQHTTCSLMECVLVQSSEHCPQRLLWKSPKSVVINAARRAGTYARNTALCFDIRVWGPLSHHNGLTVRKFECCGVLSALWACLGSHLGMMQLACSCLGHLGAPLGGPSLTSPPPLPLPSHFSHHSSQPSSSAKIISANSMKHLVLPDSSKPRCSCTPHAAAQPPDHTPVQRSGARQTLLPCAACP